MNKWKHERARALLEEQGRTRKWLANECEINVNSLSRILEGRAPGRPVQKLMALALGCSMEYLSGGKKKG